MWITWDFSSNLHWLLSIPCRRSILISFLTSLVWQCITSRHVLYLNISWVIVVKCSFGMFVLFIPLMALKHSLNVLRRTKGVKLTLSAFIGIRQLHFISVSQFSWSGKHCVTQRPVHAFICVTGQRVHYVHTKAAAVKQLDTDDLDKQKRERNNDVTNFGLSHKSNLSIGLINARSCRNKASHIAAFVLKEKIDVLAITETWLQPAKVFLDCPVRRQLTPPGYKLLDVPRPNGRGGGVAVLYNCSVTASTKAFATSSYEFLGVLLDTGFHCISMVTVYRGPSKPPRTASEYLFFKEFTKHMDYLSNTSGHILIVGDFNFHFEQINKYNVHIFRKLLCSYNLDQHVQEPTHDKGHPLDLVISAPKLNVMDIYNHGPVLSDHSALSFKVPHRKNGVPNHLKLPVSHEEWQNN